MCQVTCKYAEANSKYMKNYDKNKESFLIYVDANNLYGWTITKKLQVDGSKWVDDLMMFTEGFMKGYDEESDIDYFLFVDVEYPKTLNMLQGDLSFLPEKININKCTKLVCSLNDKANNPVHIVALKQALNHGLVLKKVHSAISFRQEAWLKPYIV